MAVSVPSLTAQQIARPQLSYCSRLFQLTELIVQIAIRIFFIAGSILMAAAAFPIHLHTIGIPIVAFSTTVLASFFFPKNKWISAPFFDALPPLLHPLQAQGQVQAAVPLPPDAPRGLVNLSQNCPFNSIVQFLESIPGVAHFLRHPLTPETNMADFQNFMAGYHPSAQLMNDFNAYVIAQVPPRPIPAMFTDFLENYVPPLRDLNNFRKIQEDYRNINLLHGAYSHLLASYDQAMRENRATVDGTQNLRLAINRITAQISPSAFQQEDAAEILTQILKILPDSYKVRIEQGTHYDVGAHPIAELPEGVSYKEDRIGYFTLEFKEGQQTANLLQLFNHFCDHQVEHHETYNVENDGVRYQSTDGEIRRYKQERCTNRILEAPPALFFQIKRFYNENNTSQSLWSWLLPSIFPPFEQRSVKRDIPVECPDEMTLNLADGTQRRYRLSSFVNHWNDSIEKGHYTADRDQNGQKYNTNDQIVSLEDQLTWDEHRRHSYLLCYLPVP